MTAVLLAVPATVSVTAAARAATPQQTAYCSEAAMVRRTLRNGTTWQLCWHIDLNTGLVLEKVSVRSPRAAGPVLVLDSITLAQLNVPYDSGANEWNDVTSYGFGGDRMSALAAGECPRGVIRSAATGAGDPGKPVLCVSQERAGTAYHLHDEELDQTYAAEGDDLVLRTISKIGWYEYVTEYRLHDDGRISARLGATGDLSPYDYTVPERGWPIGPGHVDFAAAHHHNAFWRVDFNLDGRGGERVEQYDSTPTGERGRRSAIVATVRTPVTIEAALRTANRRWWRLSSPDSTNPDGHARSYELELGPGDVYEPNPVTLPDVTFTEYRACERFATFNTDPECLARTILDYADGQPLTDPVMWVRVGFHHIPRDEDQSPMPAHWQGFELVPRDFWATNPIGPSARAGVNGRP